MLSIGKVYGRDEIIKVDQSRKLGWDMSDADQKRVAVGMTWAGIIIFLAAGFIAGFVPHQVGETTQFDDPDSTNTLLD